MNNNNEELYKSFLELLRLKLIKKYDELGLRASGSFADSLEPEIKGNKLKMWSAKHSGAMEYGIKASHHPWGPVGAIMNWIENKKSLPAIFRERKKSMAFAIAKNIANEGIKVPNQYNKGKVISDVVDEFLANDVDILLNKLGKTYAKRIQSDIVRVFKQVS